MTTQRKKVPADMRRKFIKLFHQLRQSNPELTENELYEYTWKIQNAVMFADWQIFKNEIGIK